jgi:WhiB family redox-sensing transcriptional regulator
VAEGGIEVDVVGPVLDLDVDQGHAGAGVEGGPDLGGARGQVVPADLHDGPAVGQVGVVDDRQPAVGGAPDVQLDAVGPEVDGGPERGHRVLRGDPGRTPVTDHECHEVVLSMRKKVLAHHDACRYPRSVAATRSPSLIAVACETRHKPVTRIRRGGPVALTQSRSLSLTIQPDDWREFSACRDTDPDLFFPVGTTGPAIEQIENAKAVCRTCDVQTNCLEYALTSNQDSGIWGGTSEEERRVLRRQWVARNRRSA